ncbi:TonB family protein [Persicobacter diffluens]|uniref:Protein TonB n=1 Tax=Persicobacter diffluens TaxID=981 RepID=A0AAN4VTU9_9BACT|nr:protein TonB [Persicobacter diffluens]
MELKKDPGKDLKKRRSLFFTIGLCLSLAFSIAAFNWRVYEDKIDITGIPIDGDDIEIVEIPASRIEPPKPPRVVNPVIIEIPDTEDILDPDDIDIDIEVTETDKIEDVIFTDAPIEEDPEEIVVFAEKQPAFPGGISAFYKYVSKNMNYPSQAKRQGISGKVFVQFVVDRDGSISNVEIMKGIGAGCDEEAKRVLANSPKWNPGKQRGRAVRVRMVLPITFKLN